MKSLNAIILLLILLVPSIASALSGEKEVLIEADRLEYLKESQTYHLRGHVKIVQGNATLLADSVDYNQATGDITARGNVSFDDGESLIRGEELSLNLDTKDGTIKKADILFRRDNYHVRADLIHKKGEKEYSLSRPVFTTCDAPVPEWCFQAERADIVLEDRLKARKVKFRIKGLPVLYSPFFWAPISTERKSGLLIPEVGYRSNKGLHWRQPLYLVLAPNRDMTVYLDYFSRRGLGEGLEYRYIERGTGEGKWYIFHQHDRKLEKDFLEFTGRHSLFRKEGVSGFLDVSLVNRRSYLQEYKHRVAERVQRYLESTGELSLPLAYGRLSLMARGWQDMSKEGRTGDIPQKVPEAAIEIYPWRYKALYLSLRTSLGYFYSENLHRAIRMDIHPRLLLSSGDEVRVTQSLGLRETLYSFSNTDDYPSSLSRESLDYRIRVHSGFMKKYGDVLHLMEPEVSYSFIPETEELPLLDRTELYDRVSLIEAGIRNHFFYKGDEVLSLRITEGYDFHGGDRPFGQIRLEASLFKPFPLKVDTSYDPNSGEFERINYTLGLRVKGIGISLSQRYSRKDDILSYTGGIEIPVTGKFRILSGIWYNAKGEGLQDLTIKAVYTGQCWGYTLAFNKRPDDYGIFFMIELKGLGAIKLTGI